MNATPTKVVHLVSTLGIGGQEMVIASLVRHADRSRFAPHVISLHELGPLAQRIASDGVPVETLAADGASGLALIRKLARRLREIGPHILHTHNPAPHQHGAVARVLAGVPVLIHTKHGRNNLPTRARRLAEQVAGRFTDLVVPVSRDAAEVARTVDGVPEHKLRVIHNGIAVDQLPRARVAREGRPPRAIHVARLNRIKDQPTLLRAARQVADRIPGFTLDIVGDGPMRDIVYALASELHLDGVVNFHGMQEEVAPFLADTDVFVLPSLSEGISITLLEAMGAGLPTIATDVGGNREVVVPGETGLLVPVGDATALAQAMIGLLSDNARAQRMGAAGRDRVLEEFNITRTVAAYESAYLELLARRGPAVRHAA